METFKLGFLADKYTRRARLQPALLVALPIALVVFAWFPNQSKQLGILWGLAAVSGATVLLSQVARQPGKNKEPDLFKKWDGKPTTEALRHRGSLGNARRSRIHRNLDELFPDEDVPTEEEESKNPEEADERYDLLVGLLRGKTRDSDRFSLVFEENCNYGFRRNLWGLKPYGLTIAVAAATMILGMMTAKYIGVISGSPTTLEVICALVCVALALLWGFAVNAEWVKVPAIAYRDRLFEAIDRLK